MRALLVRVGADSGLDGGGWNAPVDIETSQFAYVPIPEADAIRGGDERPYSVFTDAVTRFGETLPRNLRNRNAHLDPDFEYLTYGDRGRRGKQIQEKLRRGDLMVFYAGLRNTRSRRPLVYALMGLYVVDEIVSAKAISPDRRHENAHTRREPVGESDIVVRASQGVSGRLTRCLPFCDQRGRAYRVREDILEAWGGLSVKDGYVQRSARLPEILDPSRFLRWFELHGPTLIARNN